MKHVSLFSASGEEIAASAGPSRKREMKKQTEFDQRFVDLLKELAPSLLEKSQSPAMKARKIRDMERFRLELLVRYGQEMTDKQVSKKIANMKGKVKQKTDLKQTGNLPIVLTGAEKTMFELMGGEENPSIAERSFGLAVGATTHLDIEEDEFHENLGAGPSISPPPKRPKRTTQKSEIAELQQIVLQEQLNLIGTQDLLIRQSHELAIAQQTEKHQKEMELLKTK
ncbi:uncharacterized protein LOC129752178 [Uranotaenia lowii]|nr:uncharacterized protein LOC129752178 [Uranotaenia lowii]